MALVTTNQFGPLVPQVSLLGTGFAQGQQIGAGFQQRRLREQAAQSAGQLGQFSGAAVGGDPAALSQVAAADPQKAIQIQNFLSNLSESERAEGLRENEALTRVSLDALSLPPEQRRAFVQQRREEFFKAGRNTERTDRALAGTDAQLEQALTLQAREGQTIAELAKQQFTKDAASGFTLSPGQQRFSQGGQIIAEVAPKATGTEVAAAVIPQALLAGLSPELSSKGSAAFTAAGGGGDGLKAFSQVVDKGTEQERRLASPQLIKNSFPQASQAETVQLQAAMDAAKTTEAGLKSAAKVRVEQRRNVKAKGFQARAIELLTGILDNAELGDVLGSIEGAIDFRFQDSEAELISDIEEAGNILTADNLSLMSGVLSETDIQILKNLAGGGLIRTRSEARFRSDVTKLRDKLASQQVVTVDDEQGVSIDASRARLNELRAKLRGGS